MTPEQEAEVIRLTKAGRPFQWQADKLGLHVEAVRAKAKHHKLISFIPSNYTLRRHLDEIETSNAEINVFRESTNLLGRRYSEVNGNIFLDGMPSTVNLVMRAANSIRVRRGFPQITKNSEWIVNKVVASDGDS
jgi:hypothetical protein